MLNRLYDIVNTSLSLKKKELQDKIAELDKQIESL